MRNMDTALVEALENDGWGQSGLNEFLRDDWYIDASWETGDFCVDFYAPGERAGRRYAYIECKTLPEALAGINAIITAAEPFVEQERALRELRELEDELWL